MFKKFSNFSEVGIKLKKKVVNVVLRKFWKKIANWCVNFKQIVDNVLKKLRKVKEIDNQITINIWDRFE